MTKATSGRISKMKQFTMSKGARSKRLKVKSGDGEVGGNRPGRDGVLDLGSSR